MTGVTERATPFDRAERRIWSGKAEAYARTCARLRAHPAGVRRAVRRIPSGGTAVGVAGARESVTGRPVRRAEAGACAFA
ncbi:hypothetical protein [Streptomyces griseus]|uniref:hypothetical protein n=1 Tax=Streptomyces griseus TaxID=1911 RepID=UPI0033A96C2F